VSRENDFMWTCPKCNERFEGDVARCWKCGEKRASPLWSVLSLACPICSSGIALLFKASRHGGEGNLEIFPPGLIVVVLSCLGFGITGIVCGMVGLTKRRWPIVALVGLILSGLLLLGLFIH
jgi:hypothetical protein